MIHSNSQSLSSEQLPTRLFHICSCEPDYSYLFHWGFFFVVKDFCSKILQISLWITKCALTSQIWVAGKFNAFHFIPYIISKNTEHERPHLWLICWVRLDASFQFDSERNDI